MPDTTQIELRTMLKAYRKANSLSLAQLSDKTGIDRSALWRFEEGKPLAEHQWASLVRWFFGAQQQEVAVGK